jgi:hypothetical protein
MVTAANNVAAVVGMYIYNANSDSIISGNLIDLSTQTVIDPYIPPSGTYGEFAWERPLGMWLAGCACPASRNGCL